MWINAQGDLYEGDCAQGDRASTSEEMAAWQAARAAVVPRLVTATQIVRALAQMGLLAAVQAAVAQADPLTAALWAHASEFARDDAMIAAIAIAIGKTQADLDNLFRLAATL